MVKIFRTIAALYLLCFMVYCGYMAFSAYNYGYISKEQNHIAIVGGIVAAVLAVTNAFLSRKK